MSRTTVGILVSLIATPLCALPLTYCGKPPGAAGKTKKKNGAPTPGSIALDGLNGTIPKDVAVSSPTDTLSTSSISTMRSAGVLATSLTESLLPLVGPAAGDSSGSYDYLSKAAKLKAVLSSTTIEQCAAAIPSEMNLAQGNIAHASCFGANTRFSSHPDLGQPVEIGDTGIMFPYADLTASSGQACSAQVVNNIMHNVSSYADTAIGMQALVACAGRLAGQERPAVGEVKDMTSYLSSLSSAGKPYTIVSAAMEAASVGDKTTYVTRISGTLSDVPRNLLNRNFTLTLYHIPQAPDSETYKGVAQFVVGEFDPEHAPGKNAYISLSYDWTGTALGYRYRQVIKTPEESFDATSKELSQSVTETPSTWTEITVQNDPYGFGKLGFTWRTGDMLVFNALTKRDGTGYAFFGHKAGTSDTPGSNTFHTATGLKCYSQNPAPNGANAMTNYVQKQTMKLNATSGVWEMDQTNTTYAPTLSCNLTTGSFEVFKEGQNSWETRTATITNTLVPLSDYATGWTPPYAPQLF